MKAIIIGVGGVGSWMTPALCALIKPRNVVLVDGDTLELRNLDRQLFTENDLTQPKARALGLRYKCSFVPDWYSMTLMPHDRTDWLMVCADNHPARREALRACDASGCTAIIAANERYSSEAFLYRPAWRGGPMDPRTYYPEIETSHANDPRAAQIGCTGPAQEQTPQLVTANLMAASLALHLFVVWAQVSRKLDKETLPYLPTHLKMNMTKPEYQNQKQRTDHE